MSFKKMEEGVINRLSSALEQQVACIINGLFSFFYQE